MFQSSPCDQTGCDDLTKLGRLTFADVSILTLRSNRVRRVAYAPQGFTIYVSILTLRSNRVRRRCYPRSAGDSQFQSSPCDQTGCDGWHGADTYHRYTFQSSPCDQTGCDLTMMLRCRQRLRFQSSPCDQTGCDMHWNTDETWTDQFQSSPCDQTGCDGRPTCRKCEESHSFNPHPAIKQGATCG